MKLKIKLIFFACLLFFSAWLMWHTFSYNPESHELLIGSKVWSDFGSAIPLVRSFSKGFNWPPEYPLFPGEPSRYHFLFYLFAGFLEQLGFRLDWALNLPSAVGLFLLLVFIWKLSEILFHDFRVSFLSVIFFLFNGSFSFLDFFSKYHLSIDSLSRIFTNSVFPSFGPWNGSLITAFWNLNIYTNQRHLGFSFALSLIVIYLLYFDRKKYLYFLGFITGALFFINQAAFAITGLFLLWFFLVRSRVRLPLLISTIGALPWFLLWTQISSQALPPVQFQLGFLTPSPVTIFGFLKFWLYNFGLHLLFIPLGFVVAPKKAKILIIPLLILFLVPNLFRLSVDMINNHKFFNFFLIISVMFSANFFIHLGKSGFLGKILLTLILPFLIFGGLIDFFPIKNDYYLTLLDAPANPDVNFFLHSTPPDAVILNSTWFYHPASLAGRFIYNGYSYFTWSYGYDQVTRERNLLTIYSSLTKATTCQFLLRENISYVELNPQPENFIQPNWDLWNREFEPVYTNPVSQLKIFSVSQNCL